MLTETEAVPGPRTAALVAALALLWAAPAAARPQLVAAFEDDAGDANGPGSYVPPGDAEMSEADFDLRRFEVYRDGDDAVFKVTLGAAFRTPGATARTGAVPLDLWNNIYFQNIDIYIDTNRDSAAGYFVCIPGRRVTFAGGHTWKAAVVLTPQPGSARGITADALGEAADHISFPENLQTHGRTVTARVPFFELGGPPDKGWGYSVHVSGARWERSFAAVDRMAHGKPGADALTMPVVPVREAWMFGGAPTGNTHPRVVDVLLPRGANQKAVLGSFNKDTGDLARVPFVYLTSPPPAVAASSPPTPPSPGAEPPAAPAPPEFRVIDLEGGTVTLAGPSQGLAAMQIGKVLDKDGQTVARVLVVRTVEAGVVCSILDGGDLIRRGATVRFSP